MELQGNHIMAFSNANAKMNELATEIDLGGPELTTVAEWIGPDLVGSKVLSKEA
jgi:hypothetical protein